MTGARNMADGEMIQSILLDHGIPSMLRRARGFDVPDFLAAGPRDVLVPESGYEAARDVLAGSRHALCRGAAGLTARDRVASATRAGTDRGGWSCRR